MKHPSFDYEPLKRTPSNSVAEEAAEFGFQKSDVFGGPLGDHVYNPEQPAGDPGFAGDDVRNAYTGNPLATLEAVNTQRIEGTGKVDDIRRRALEALR